MTAVPYARQLARSVYFFWYFTFPEVAALTLTVCLLLGALESITLSVAVVGIYGLYASVVRPGRPPGFDFHFVRARLAPKVLRPGPTRRRVPIVRAGAIPRGPAP